MRIRSIDSFRGIAVVLMVFFTVLSRLADVPDFLKHNEPGALHFGDLVLPIFLFASGMSLVFFMMKRKGMLDVTERIGTLIMISALLSPLSAGGLLKMDEIMLNAILSVPCIALLFFPEWITIALIILIYAAYVVLLSSGMLPDFGADYLGGYPAALFYLPVMLCGTLAGKRIAKRGEQGGGLLGLLIMTGVVCLVLLALVPPYKMIASPSFMALSVCFSLLAYMLLEEIGTRIPDWLVYLGKRTIRYWVLMWALIIAPITFYAIANGKDFPIGIGWTSAVILSLLSMAALFVACKALDRFSPILSLSSANRKDR